MKSVLALQALQNLGFTGKSCKINEDGIVTDWLSATPIEQDLIGVEALRLTVLSEKKKELLDYANSLSYFTVGDNEYSISPKSILKINLALSSVWLTDTKEWYERDYTVKFMTTKVDLEKVLCEADTLIQIKRVEIFGAVT